MPKLSKVSRTSVVIGFILTALGLITALQGPVILLPVTFIPMAASIGILRRRAWSAYGFAIYSLANLLLMPFLLLLPGGHEGLVPVIVTSVVMMLASTILFFLTGRSLAATNSSRGRAYPWIAVAILSTVPLLFVRVFVMPTSSMENTLLVGDRILVRCVPSRRVTQGDVIVFKYPRYPNDAFVKRVIGIPGDRIRIEAKRVYRNGIALKEAYVVHKTDDMVPYRDDFPSPPDSLCTEECQNMLANHVTSGEITVPAESYFVLGDNRDNSLDSRYWGFVHSINVIGKPILIYESETTPTSEGFVLAKPRWDRFFKIL